MRARGIGFEPEHGEATPSSWNPVLVEGELQADGDAIGIRLR